MTEPSGPAGRESAVSSLTNDTVKLLVSLRRRRVRQERGLFLLEGFRLVREALARGADIEKIFVCPENAGSELNLLARPAAASAAAVALAAAAREVSPAVMRKISALETPPGIVALARIPPPAAISPPRPGEIVLAADCVRDPGNLGAMLRAALAAGVTTVCLTAGAADLWNPKTLRGAMGVLFSQRFMTGLAPAEVIALCRRWDAVLAVCRMDGRSVFTAAPPAGKPLVLVVGSEGEGVAAEFKAAADLSLAVPMEGGVESLNAATAAAICLYALRRRVNPAD